MSNILVTGGAGFIGSNIAEKLVNLKHRIVILDDFSTGKRKNLGSFIDSPLCRFVEGTILNGKQLESLLREERIEYILHQAARPSVAKSVADPLKTNEINVNGTLNVLQAALEEGVKRVVVASSSSIYGDTPELPKRESMPHNPQSPYAITKVIKELYLKNFYRIYGLNTVGLRYFNVYGKRQDPDSDYAAVIPKFINQALKNEDLTIEDDGSGDIDIRDVGGDLTIEEDGSGGIYIREVGGDVAIDEDGSGTIDIRRVGRDVNIGQDASPTRRDLSLMTICPEPRVLFSTRAGGFIVLFHLWR